MQHKHDRSQIKNGKEHVGTGAGRSQNRKTFEKKLRTSQTCWKCFGPGSKCRNCMKLFKHNIGKNKTWNIKTHNLTEWLKNNLGSNPRSDGFSLWSGEAGMRSASVSASFTLPTLCNHQHRLKFAYKTNLDSVQLHALYPILWTHHSVRSHFDATLADRIKFCEVLWLVHARRLQSGRRHWTLWPMPCADFPSWTSLCYGWKSMAVGESNSQMWASARGHQEKRTHGAVEFASGTSPVCIS